VTREDSASRAPGGEQENRAIPDALDETRLTPSPPVNEFDAAEAILACYGLAGDLTRLPGEADDNFLLDSAGRGGRGNRYVVKFAHLRADPAVVGVQVRVLRHIEAAAPALPVPRVLTPLEPAAPAGQPWAVVPDGPLRGRVVHALSYLDGRLLRSVTTDPPLRRAMGGSLAETSPSCPSSARWPPNVLRVPAPPCSPRSSPGSPPRPCRGWRPSAASCCTTTSARTTR
jgi:hypothetical protein